MLTEFPPLIKHFADTRDLFADAVEALGRISVAADNALAPASDNLQHQPGQPAAAAASSWARASPYLIGALKLMLTAPFSIENVPKVVRGDYLNVSLMVDLTLSALDNSAPVGHRCLGHAARARAGLGPRPGDDDPGRAVHAEPAQRCRADRWSKGVSEQC